MELRFSEEENLARDSVAGVLGQHVTQEARQAWELSETGFDAKLWEVFAEMGWLAAAADKDPANLILLGIICEEMGKVSLATPFVETASAALALARFDTAGARAQLQAVAGGGRILGWLPEARIEGATVTMSRRLVEWASAADAFVVAATGADGKTALCIIDAKQPGVTIETVKPSDNGRAAFVTIEGVRVGDDQIVSRDAAASLAEHAASRQLLQAAEALGGAEGALALTAEYVKGREQFGRAIATFQAVQHGLADLRVLTENAWLITWEAFSLAGQGKPIGAKAALACWHAIKALQAAAVTGSQYHGGMGYTMDYPMQFYYRRAGTVHARIAKQWDLLGTIAEGYVDPYLDAVTN